MAREISIDVDRGGLLDGSHAPRAVLPRGWEGGGGKCMNLDRDGACSRRTAYTPHGAPHARICEILPHNLAWNVGACVRDIRFMTMVCEVSRMQDRDGGRRGDS